MTRRRLLHAGLVAPAALLLAACGGSAASAPTPMTAPADKPTDAAPTRVPAAPTQAPSTPPTATAAPSATTATQPTTKPSTATAPPQPTATPAATAPAPQSTSTAAGAATKPAAGAAASQSLPPTPACTDADEPTIAQTEGPYYSPNTPERTSLLEAGMAGTKLTLTGRVLSTRCQSVNRALLDFWQADDGGAYDNVGFKLRGHQFSDAQGSFMLETIVPGLYPGRTRHIHVKVQAPNRPVLTTQLYFPNEPRNNSDGIFNRKLVIAVQDAPGGGKLGAFDFVLNLG